MLGINLGHLGFMADVPISDIYPSLQDLIQGSNKIHQRLRSKEKLFMETIALQ